MPLDGEGNPIEGEGGGGATGSEPAWAKALGEQMGGLTGVMRDLMQQAANQPRGRATPEPDDEEDDELPPEELETLDRSAFGKYLTGQVLKAINKQVVAPINEQLAAITNKTTGNEIRADVQGLASQHKDFWEWKDEMIALANENKGIAPRRLYQLARADNPKKAEELDIKHGLKPKPGSESPRKQRLNFGGLTPGSSGAGSRNQKMTPKDAATAAWAETVTALGGELDFGDDD
jgi:hypothetical protein